MHTSESAASVAAVAPLVLDVLDDGFILRWSPDCTVGGVAEVRYEVVGVRIADFQASISHNMVDV